MKIKTDALIQPRARNKRQKRVEEERDKNKRIIEKRNPETNLEEDKRFGSFGCQENTSQQQETIIPNVENFIH